MGTAQIRFSRTELVASVTLAANKTANGGIKVHPDSAPILKKLATAFTRAKWERCNFYYKPLVGAMYSGAITMGVDWDNEQLASTRETVAAYAPSATLPLREDGESKPIKLSPDKMRARTWWCFTDDQPNLAGPATLAWAAAGESAITVGEIYMTYTVVLDGPHA